MNWTVTQYLDWKLSEIQTMVLEKKPSADIIHELQRVRETLVKKETIVDSVAAETIESQNIDHKGGRLNADLRDLYERN